MLFVPQRPLKRLVHALSSLCSGTQLQAVCTASQGAAGLETTPNHICREQGEIALVQEEMREDRC